MKKYGLLGYPLTHSFSKQFFTEKFQKERIDSEYLNFEIKSVDQVSKIIEDHPDLAGLNVTIPYKEVIIPFLNDLHPEAKEISAVNTIRIARRQGEVHLTGFNTDIWGFEQSLNPLLKSHHKNALILGTGGASKAIQHVLKKLGINFLTATTRTPSVKSISYSDITKQLISDFTLIINTTPLGTYPNTSTFPDIPYEYLSTHHLLYDLVYNPQITIFLEKGKEQGAVIKNGYEMLILQALKSYEIWEQL